MVLAGETIAWDMYVHEILKISIKKLQNSGLFLTAPNLREILSLVGARVAPKERLYWDVCETV